MLSTLLPILGIIIVIIIAFKFLRSMIKGIIILALIIIAVIIFNNMSNGTLSLNTITSKFQSQVQQNSNQELNAVVQKLKNMNSEQVEAYLKNSKSELEKYGLSVDKVKEALAKYNQGQ